MSVASQRRVIAGYELQTELAVGGMASVHLGRSLDPRWPHGLVAIKRLHEHLARDASFAGVLLQEARITARIQHPNVVRTLDVVSADRELLLVMEYVPGETVAGLLRAAGARDTRCTAEIAASIARDMLLGLHAAHETRDESGALLEVVHRDVSPQNVIVATSGVAKVLDFGIAKAVGNVVQTRTGELKGKIPYMAPEILALEPASRQSDLWAAAVVLWELLCGRRLFRGESEVNTWAQVLNAPIASPGEVLGAATPLDAIVMRGLSRDRTLRYATAAEMADDIERAIRPASAEAVAAWVDSLVSEEIATRRQMLKSLHDTVLMTAPLTTPRQALTPVELAAPSLEATPPAAPPRRRRRVWALVGAAGAGVVALLAARASLEAAAGAPAEVALAAAVPSAPTHADAEDAGLDAADTADPPSEPSAAPAATTRRHPRPRPFARPAPRPRGIASCDPPYTVDPTGRKIFKLECIK